MAINFNVDPYYDDFDPTKNFHRVLFKPGYAVQARELTQSQTILQDQVTKFADHVFKQNSPVTGGQITTNLNCYYIKLQTTFNGSSIDVTQFDGLLVQNSTGTVIAKVIAVAAATGSEGAGDPPTLIVVYKTGTKFTNSDIIYSVNSNLAAQAITSNSTDLSSAVSIADGVFYVLGNFVQIQSDTIVIDKYSNAPSKRIGLTITETIFDYINDSSLLDPAIGASNYQAPGADRYVISLALSSRPIQLGDDQNFIELVRIENGVISKLIDTSVYNVIDDYFAKRDYETNGDYIVNDFKLTPKANTANSSVYDMSVGKGIAYVHGYRLENSLDVTLTSNRARSTDSQINTPVYIDYGSYFYVDTVRGGASGTFFDVTTAQQIDLHCVSVANVNTTNTATYNATVVGSGYIRNFVYDYSTSDADSNTYVYKAFVNDIQNAVQSANAISATTNTITLPGTFSTANDAYTGVTISITNGRDAGDFRTIVAYNGTTKVATVNQNWTVVPDTTSVFQLNFDIKDTETIIYADKSSYPATIRGRANINVTGRSSVVLSYAGGDVILNNTILENPSTPELLFTVGSPYVASLQNSSYNTQQLNRGVVFGVSGGSATATISYSGDYAGVMKHLGPAGSSLSADTIKQNFMIVVTSKGSSSLNVGEIIPWSTKGGTVTLNGDSSTATLSIPTSSVAAGFTATVLEKVYASIADNPSHLLKYKNLITANTNVVVTSGTSVNTYTFVDDTTLTSSGQVYIQNAGLVSPGNKQSLYLVDVKSIVKIIDTKSSGTTPIVSMLTNSLYDVTNNYSFDNGQRDSYYDHASITLKPGAPQPTGNLLVLVNYYQHTGGDGYFSLTSFLNSAKPETYQQIPFYKSTYGTVYYLRDSVDFRPARTNATSAFTYKYNDAGDNRYGVFIPTDLSTYATDYNYYLGRKDKLILTKDRSFNIIEGTPSTTPLFPAEPDGSLVVAKLTHNPYTGYIPTEVPAGTSADLSIEKVKHKRYTMHDISGLENRINNIEYYTSLSLLEQNAQSLQIPDAYGINRFKNGILVDDFSGYGTADTSSDDYNTTINRREKNMTASQTVNNYPLQSVAKVFNGGVLSSSALSSLGYSINSDGNVNYFTLPYTTANVAIQKFASRTVNINPFAVSDVEGVLSLSPNMDNWVDKNYAPALLITDPNLKIYKAGTANNILQYGDWKTTVGTSTVTRTTTPAGTTTTTSTPITKTQQNIVGNYDNISNTYAMNNGYVTDVSILPYIRPQEILLRARNMQLKTTINAFFDGVDVKNYIRKSNIVELTGVSGTFKEDDIVGYYTGGSYYPTGRVAGVYVYPGTTNVRLYIVGDNQSSYTSTGTLLNIYYNAAGSSASSTASGTLSSTNHFAGRIVNTISTTSLVLSSLASANNNYYNGNTVYISVGTGAGSSSTISAYNGTTKTITLSSPITVANGSVYSIGTFTTDEAGNFYSLFNVPENTFHNGQRTFRFDNSINGNQTSTTTFSQGSFYSEGLQTRSQNIDFGASPSGAKNTFTKTEIENSTQITSTFQAARLAGGGAGCCFVAGTKVTMADGSIKNIEDVQLGEQLIGKDDCINTVMNFIRPVLGDRKLVSINGSDPFVTDDHPLFVRGFGWKSFDPAATKKKYKVFSETGVGQLQVGDVIETLDKVGLLVESLESHTGDFDLQVYNFELDGNHTYIANNLVAHNKGTDPLAQSFTINKDVYPNGIFLKSIRVFFASKPTSDSSTVKLSIVGTLNGYPNGETLDHSIVVLTPDKVNVSTLPQYLDQTTSTSFDFSVPVYLQPGVLYAFILKTDSSDYTVWSAYNGDTALASSVKNLPTDATPSTITKISAAPFIGGIFKSQNAQTWEADQNQSAMFVMDRCVFNMNTAPTLQFVVPKRLPQRAIIDQSVDYYLNANNISNVTNQIASSDVYVDAFNISTTDFIPSGTKASYSYNATLVGGSAAGIKTITPGKFGTPTQDDIYLSDGLGKRVLSVNTSTSFSVYSQLQSLDDSVSPMISDAGLSVYSIKWDINNCALSNSLITLVSGGSSYNANTTSVTISAPTGTGSSQAYASANIVGGIVRSVYLTNVGSGYITTPIITITDANTTPGTGASATLTGETSKSGGPATAKYVTKKVILEPGYDAGDMNVYITAYRPVNTDINVYYKILNRNDTQDFNNSVWQLMTKINSSESTYSATRSDLYEYSFAPGTIGTSQGYVSYTSTNGQTYTSFSQFAIKVVLTSTDSTYTPFCTDIRAIALPSNV
jgi:hypothetical protein